MLPGSDGEVENDITASEPAAKFDGGFWEISIDAPESVWGG